MFFFFNRSDHAKILGRMWRFVQCVFSKDEGRRDKYCHHVLCVWSTAFFTFIWIYSVIFLYDMKGLETSWHTIITWERKLKAADEILVLAIIHFPMDMFNPVSAFQSWDTTSISLTAGCDLFMRYVTRTSALEYEDFNSAKSRLIERAEKFGEISYKVSKLILTLWGNCFTMASF